MKGLTEKQKGSAVIRIVDDDESVRQALTVFFSMADWQVKTYEDGPSFLAQVDFNTPGCAILDVRMPKMSGIELFDQMLARRILLPVIFLSAHGDIEMAVEAVQRGAKTFLVKPPDTDKLLETVESAVADDFVHRKETEYGESLQRQWKTLTPAEQQVAWLIGKGMTNAAAAEVVGVAERTIRGQRASIYQKLDVENAVEMSDFLHELQQTQAMVEDIKP